MPRKKAEKPVTKKTSKKTTAKKAVTKKETSKKKIDPLMTQKEDIQNIIRYLKSENRQEAYNKYITPIIKQKGRKYVDRLLGSTVIVLHEKGLSLDNLSFDVDDKLTVVKKEG